MSNHVIFATDLLPQWIPTPLRYFMGYLDDGAKFEPNWTFDPWKACWIDAAEVETELALLTRMCPGVALKAWSLHPADKATTTQGLA